MDSNKAPLTLEVQQRSFPVSSGSPSQTVDWLPNYFGYSWVAYASRSSLVISIIPSPTSKHEEELGLCQVIDSPHDAPAHILCVRWAPSPVGLLGASCEHLIWIYTPQFSNPHDEYSSPDFPRGWVLANKLEHTFKVWSFGWTESGDGLLSVGTEVIMWKQDESGWRCLWTSPVTHPQVFAAATWSANGLAATAEGNSGLDGRSSQAGECNQSAAKGKATVWWWEDSLGLLESELVHPKEIVFLQWRPSKGPLALNEAFRPVLLTACKDGAVRLWLEIDSGRARLDKYLGKDVSAKHLKPAYFVSAVIEAEQCLNGVLGADVFVSWPLECRTVKPDSASACSSTAITKRQNPGSCEWLVGLGPEGSIFLWSVFCLDDIYPPRCPRVFLWKQAGGVLSIPVPPPGSESRQVLLKIVAQRLSSRCTDPPSTLDLFYTSQPNLFQWSRIWPPISALCGDSSKKSDSPEVGAYGIVSTKTRKDVWGVVTENFNLNGHPDDIISIATHPITFTGLVATLDSQGHIFLWCTSFFLNRSSSLFASVWRSSGESLVSLESNTLTWLPAVFSGGQTVLLLAHAGFVDCYLISEVQKTTSCSQPLAVKLLCSLNLAVHSPEQFLAIWALPLDVQNIDFVIIGLGKASGKLVSCYLQIIEEEINSHDMDRGPSDQLRNEINFLVKNISSKNFGAFESFTSVALPPVNFLPFLQTQSDSIMYEPLGSSHVYDVATGSGDGVLRLWKRGAQYSTTENSEVVIKDDVWQCVGFLKVSSGPVTMIAIGWSGLKMATWCPASVDIYGEGILIWSIERVSERASFYLSDRVSVVGSPISMQWLDLGNGGSFLGLLMQSELLVYTESRAFDKRLEFFAANKNQGKQTSEQLSWRLLASRALFSRTSCFSWGPKGSLLVSFKEHLLVYDLGFFPDTDTRVQNQEDLKFLLGSQRDQAWSLVRAGAILSSPLPVHHPVTMLYHLYTGNHQRARACLWYLQQNLSDLSSNIQGKLPSGLLQIYSTAQLLEIFLKEAKAEKNESKTQEAFLSWSAGNARDFEDYAASFSRLSLAGEDINKESTHHESETSKALNVEKLEFLLGKSLDVLGLTEEQRMQLLNVADVLVKMDSESKALEYASLDRAGQRFWLAVQLSHSRQSRKGSKFVRIEDLCLDTKAMAWALQSECKDTLLDLCLGSEISWPAMRVLGAGFWLIDTSQLRSRMEKLARAQFLADRNPKHCALLYLALQRKNVLMGLFKLSKDDKDRVLYEFLGRDFSVEKNRAAALKNAYILLGKHQHDLAAAFFLLGGDLGSAASACAKNLGDLQLALVICRLFEGTNGPNEQRLVREYALTNARNEGDYWLASLFQWLLGERIKAIEEMTGHLGGVFESGYEDRESSCEVSFPDSIRGAFVDPEVGMFCLHLASKPVMQSGLNNAAMTALCKWLCLRTSATLERLGLSLEALEYLHSAKDSFWTNLQPNKAGISGAVVNHLTAFKNRLALQFQAQLVMAHPCWLFGTRAGFNGSDQTQICISATEASKKLLQSLDLLEYGFTVDSRCIAAEISRFAHCHNMLYIQCVFTRGVSDGAHDTRELMSLPCLKFLNHSVKRLGQELFKIIDPMSLSHYQPYFWTESFGRRERGVFLENATETLLLAIDLWLLLGQSGDNTERNVDVALLPLVLYSVAAWKKSDLSAIGCITRFIMSHESTLSIFAFDMEAAFRLLLGVTTPSMTEKMSLNLGQLTEIEVWHVLGLAFWNAFLGWGKQHVRNNPASDQESNTSSVQFASQKYALDKGLLKALESIGSIFQRKLVFFLNTSMKATHLCSWLLANRSSTEVPPRKCQESSSNVPTACDMKAGNMKSISHMPSHTPFSSKDCLMDEVWEQLLVPSSIRSAVELGGAKLAASAGKTCIPECLEGSKKNIVEPIMKNNAVESALHDSEGLPGSDNKEKSIGYVMENGSGEVTSNSTSYTATCSVHYKIGEEVLHSSGDLLEAISVNSCCPDQVVVASSRKGLLYFDINNGKSLSYSESSLWSRAEWPQNGWANSESTPIPTFVSPGVGLRSKEGPSLGLGGATVGVGMLSNVAKESSFKGVGVGIPGYGGMGALGLGWEEWEDYEGVIDPLATMENVNTQAMDSHPLRPLFLVGSRNTHIYLWEFGKSSATATYGILPAANVPPPYALASVSSVKFDHSGHRFATSAIDGTVCTWQLEVGGRSNVRPTDSCLCFDRHASDVAFVGGSGGIIAATGASQNNSNLVFWDTLAPLSTSQAFVYCHEGGARCLEMFDQDVGGGSISSLIVTCGKGGDVAVHDFRYIATGKTKRAKNFRREHGSLLDNQSSRKQQDGELNVDGSVWYIAKAHSGSITCVSAVPGTSLFFTGSKDGDVKLWDVNKCELVNHWHRVHDKHMFLQHNARGFGAVVQESRGFGGFFQAAVTDIKPVSLGFLTCGGDGTLRLFRRCKAGAII